MRKDIEKQLLPWEPSDGPYIHLAALRQALPGYRWDLYLIGITAGHMPLRHRTKPLLGRLKRNAAVVLMSSLADWLAHYNPTNQAGVEQMLEDLRKAERRYVKKLELIRAEVQLKHGETLGRKPAEKPAKAKPQPRLKVTSNELFKVWG